MRKTLGTIMFLGATLLSGCSDKEIHIDKVREAFQALPPEQKTKLETGLTALAASNYAAALPPLQSFAFGTKMTPDQRKILSDTIAKASARARDQK